MSNTTTYSNSRFGVEKIMTFPVMSMVTPIDIVLTLTEDIIITEIVGNVTDKISGAAASMTVAISTADTSTTLATVSLPSDTDAGTASRQTTITTDELGVSGATLLVSAVLSATHLGSIAPYIKYKSVYQA